jgi:hypothetical protein
MPDPRHWDAFAVKWLDFFLGAPDWTTGQLNSIRAPVLVMIGDREGVTLEHAQALRSGDHRRLVDRRPRRKPAGLFVSSGAVFRSVARDHRDESHRCGVPAEPDN